MKTVIIDGVKMTFEQAHRMLWTWLSKHKRMDKEDFFNIHKIKGIRNHCFACESCKSDCRKCPIKVWKKDAEIDSVYSCNFFCDNKTNAQTDGLYGDWANAMDRGKFDLACSIAKKISELEWEED